MKIVKCFIFLILIFLISLTIYQIFKKPKNSEPVIISKIETYGYNLEDNKPKLYSTYFETLKKELNKEEVDQQKYAELIVKLFISDFYDLDSKITKNDIGGLQFIKSEALDNMVIKAKDTIYKYVENNVNKDRKQVLPKVKDIVVETVEETTYVFDDKKDLVAYKVNVYWQYVKDLGYQDEAIFILLKNEKKLEIVEIRER